LLALLKLGTQLALLELLHQQLPLLHQPSR
jgi:hypothetical protein